MFENVRKSIPAVLTLALCSHVVHARENRTQRFSVPSSWHVPAAVLPPGNYSITVLDHLPDRAIVKIESADGATHSTFIGMPNRGIRLPSSAGPVMWERGKSGDLYLRGWKFAGDPTVLEFAYPKADAVAIARQVNSPVPAVDPDSEGMKAEPNALASKADMDVISLWLLSADKVNPDPEKAEIKAARYQPGPAAPEPKHVAVAGSRLPKTASELPLVLMGALLAFALAILVRRARQSESRI